MLAASRDGVDRFPRKSLSVEGHFEVGSDPSIGTRKNMGSGELHLGEPPQLCGDLERWLKLGCLSKSSPTGELLGKTWKMAQELDRMG